MNLFYYFLSSKSAPVTPAVLKCGLHLRHHHTIRERTSCKWPLSFKAAVSYVTLSETQVWRGTCTFLRQGEARPRPRPRSRPRPRPIGHPPPPGGGQGQRFDALLLWATAGLLLTETISQSMLTCEDYYIRNKLLYFIHKSTGQSYFCFHPV